MIRRIDSAFFNIVVGFYKVKVFSNIVNYFNAILYITALVFEEKS